MMPGIFFDMKTRPNTNDTLVANLRALMKASGMKKPELSQKSGVSERMIGYVLSGERKPTVELAEALAGAFHLKGWHLIINNLPVTLADSGKLDKLVQNYALSSENGRNFIDRVAEQEAKYQKVVNDK